jgi:hypothetical protein
MAAMNTTRAISATTRPMGHGTPCPSQYPQTQIFHFQGDIMDIINKFAKDIAFKIGKRLIDLSETIPVQPAPIQRMAVISSNVKSIGYRLTDRTLEIEFLTGRIYRYADVPFYIYEELIDAPSVGRYFNLFIRNRYETEEVK